MTDSLINWLGSTEEVHRLQTAVEGLKTPLDGEARLDVGCGNRKQPGWIGMDARALDGVDIVHDIEELPWPIPDNSCGVVLMSHVWEHLKPWLSIRIMEEMWRVLAPGGQLQLVTPYGWSHGFVMDPTHCFSDDTDVLTETGWKKIIDVREGELVRVLDPKTTTVSLSRVTRKILQPYIGEMLHFETKRMDLLVTPNHDLLWQSAAGGELQLSRADSFLLLRGHHPRRGFALAPTDDHEPAVFRIPRVDRGGNNAGKKMPIAFPTEDFAELIGWYIAEGSLYHGMSNYAISIAQSASEEKRQRIVKLAKLCGLTPKLDRQAITFSSKDLFQYLKPLGHSAEKYIPLELKRQPTRVLSRLLKGLLGGDGRDNGRGREYATTSKRLASDVQEIALRCGYRSTVYTETRPGTTVIRNQVVNQSELIWLVGVSPPCPVYYPKPKRTHYIGNIACITVAEHHTILVRRNGRAVWSGNCNPVNEDTFRYFDPTFDKLYKLYEPKPWKILKLESQRAGNLFVVMEPIGKERAKLHHLKVPKRETIEVDLVTEFHKAQYDDRKSIADVPLYRGRPIDKFPADLWRYIEIIDKTTPELLIETGTANGASALFFLDQMRYHCPEPRIVTIDTDDGTAPFAENPSRVNPGERPKDGAIEYLIGSSMSEGVLRTVSEKYFREPRRTMVVLDSDHSFQHVLNEMKAYSPLVTTGCYLVVEDSEVNGHPVYPGYGPGPWEAVEHFLSENPDMFERDEAITNRFMGITSHTWLRRR